MIVDNNAKSLEERVYFALKDEILSGQLKRGDTLTEISLSTRLGVSRTPLRGALHRLDEEGLIALVPNKGAEVVGVDIEDLIHIYKIRMRLEGLAARLAADRMSDEDRAHLTEITELSEFYVERGDDKKRSELDSEFHNTIFRASGSRHLNKILSDLHKNIKTYRRLSLKNTNRAEKSILEHRGILEAILKKDADEAERLTYIHIEQALLNFENKIKEM